MLTAEMKKLRDTFEGWTRGNPFPTIEAWFQFRNELRELSFKVAMLELGVDLTVVDVAVEASKAGSNVVVLQPRQRRVIPLNDGGAS
jgi:hypothetical protein